MPCRWLSRVMLRFRVAGSRTRGGVGVSQCPLRVLDLVIDTGKPTGKLVLTVLGGIAEFEREIMLERQREGIAKARAAGKYKGRKPTARAKADEVKALKAQGVGPTAIAKQMGIGRASVCRILGNGL